MLLKIFALLPLLSYSIAAHGDILFLGFNPAPGEIRAVQEAATKRNEKVIVLPAVADKVLQRMEAIDQKQARLIKQVETLEDSNAINQLSEKILQLQEEKDSITKSVSLTTKTLSEHLMKMEKKGLRLSSVILSGHDGNGKFWGTLGEGLSSSELKESFSRSPDLAASVQTMLLLGCYTTSIGSLDTYWKDIFPHVKVFAGYESKGPLATSPVGHGYIKEFLLKEQNFSKAKTREEMWELFRRLPQIRSLAASVASEEYHVTNQGARSIEELYQRCQSVSFQSPLRKSFTCYYEANKGCEDIPADTKQGPIRKFYEELQANAHCKDMLTINADHALPAPPLVLSVIFFENIRGNFYRLYRREILELESWIADLGFSSLDLLARPRSRAELLRDIRQLRSSLMKWGRGRYNLQDFKSSYVTHYKASLRLEEIDRILLRMTVGCIPSAWVDPLVPGRSACFSETAKLEKDAEKNWLQITSSEEK